MNNSPYHRATDESPLSRRDFLWQSGGGLGGLALTSMLGREPLLAKGVLSGTLHHPPKAKRVIQLFMGGAASHLDTFDFKPALIKHHGEKSDFGEHVEAFQNGLGPWMQSPFAFARHGQSGKHLSEAVAPLSEVVDDLAFVHNLVGKTGVHSQATYLQATGFQRPGFTGMGSWVSYALGSENENLPTFVVLPDHRGYASNGPKNWASAFLPTHTQGTTIFPQRENPIPDLHPKAAFVTPASHRAGIELINQLNAGYAETRPGDDRLEARIQTYELAARLQLSATEALDIAKAATPRALTETNAAFDDSYGLPKGTRVTVAAVDYGVDPVEGDLLVSTRDSVGVLREDPRVGQVVVHFPRVGYAVRKVEAAG